MVAFLFRKFQHSVISDAYLSPQVTLEKDGMFSPVWGQGGASSGGV